MREIYVITTSRDISNNGTFHVLEDEASLWPEYTRMEFCPGCRTEYEIPIEAGEYYCKCGRTKHRVRKCRQPKRKKIRRVIHRITGKILEESYV